jgi:hypothetical protein
MQIHRRSAQIFLWLLVSAWPLYGQVGAHEQWPLFSPGQLPPGETLTDTEAAAIKSDDFRNQTFYLIGQFLVTASGAQRAVLRTGGQGGPIRVVVEFPLGMDPPPEGAVVSRDESRPFQITMVRINIDGQVTLYVREIVRPYKTAHRLPIRRTIFLPELVV